MNCCKYFYVNKAVVGFGHVDMPKYAGEGVALQAPPGEPGRSCGSKSMQFHVVFHECCDVPQMCHIQCAS